MSPFWRLEAHSQALGGEGSFEGGGGPLLPVFRLPVVCWQLLVLLGGQVRDPYVPPHVHRVCVSPCLSVCVQMPPFYKNTSRAG